MKIDHIDIQNFRKLKNCQVRFAEGTTIFVGANNSGKTSAMDALMIFLKKTRRKELSTTDITLSNWAYINQIGFNWVNLGDISQPDLELEKWRLLFPCVDIWLDVPDRHVHRVSHILPTLAWDGGLIGVRLILEPKNVEKLYAAYKSAYSLAKDTMESRSLESQSTLALWPNSMREFLDKKLQEFFTVNAYLLNPELVTEASPQQFTELMDPLDAEPFDGLFKIDIINAQRGFTDANAEPGVVIDGRLSSQLRHYFNKHLNPLDQPDSKDLDALEAIDGARNVFDEKLNASFQPAISELEGLNYPGFADPRIILSSKVNPLESLNHDTAVQFQVYNGNNCEDLRLPEKHNGLGYQNLISMIFNLVRFRDEWMRVGKLSKHNENSEAAIEPLHLILIEEPEAHLHPQVQQVFIKKAFKVLRNHPDLGEKPQFSTQMVISTHSSHIAHEADFTGLRYFYRERESNATVVPTASVVSMSQIFGVRKTNASGKQPEDIATAQFATRYLKTTHCDLFFADAVIMVEGPAERMLVPHFIKTHYPKLYGSYISILEIGGSHAHRLHSLIDALKIPTLIITDLDSIQADSESKAQPLKGTNLRTGNHTLKSWVPKKGNLDELLTITAKEKIIANGKVRVAYPNTVKVSFRKEEVELEQLPLEDAVPYTFEDALVLANINLFREIKNSKGLTKKMVAAINSQTLDEACSAMFTALNTNAKKAEMALDLLYLNEPNTLVPPEYIKEGLAWLQVTLCNNNDPDLKVGDEND